MGRIGIYIKVLFYLAGGVLMILIIWLLVFSGTCYAQSNATSATPIWHSIVIGFFGTVIGGLVAYFFSTRNLESKMRTITKEIVKEDILVHSKTATAEGKLEVLKIVELTLRQHKKECGKDLENKMEGVKKDMEVIKINQERFATILEGVSINVNDILNEMRG